MAEIQFLSGDGLYSISNNGSGVAFFGAGGFGQSVGVGSYQDTTYISDANGSVQGPNITNWKWMHASSGKYSGDDVVYALSGCPNSKSTMRIDFTHSTPVKVQNAKFRIYDRVNILSGARDVTTKIAENCRPDSVFGSSFGTTTNWGSGSTQWFTFSANGTGQVYTFINQSPGASGVGMRNTNTSGTLHSWYLNVSCLPETVGSKTFAGYVSLEYL